MILSKASKLIALATLSVASSSSFADIAFDNFGPGNAVDHAMGLSVFSVQSVACQFNPVVSGKIDTITIALGLGMSYYAPADFNLAVYSDSGGGLGSKMYDWTVNETQWYYYAPITFLPKPVVPVIVQKGTPYWLVASPVNGSDGAWNYALPGPNQMGNFGYFQDGGWHYFADSQLGAFRVETSPVPEPRNFVVVAGFTLGLWMMRRRN